MEKFPPPEIVNNYESDPKAEIVADLAAKRALLLDEKNDPDLEMYNKIVAFAEHLQSVQMDCENYELYHLLVGSTSMQKCPNFDFPEDDSIAKFIEDMYKKMKQ
jgi:hypothetical protein